MYVVRAVFLDANKEIVFIREQSLGMDDTLQNMMRRFSTHAVKRLLMGKGIESFKIECIWKE